MDIIDFIIGFLSLNFLNKVEISNRSKSLLSGIIYLILFLLIAFIIAWLF